MATTPDLKLNVRVSMNDWLSLPSGEIVRVSEIAAVVEYYETGKYSRPAVIVLRSGREIITPWSVADVQPMIVAIEKKPL